MAKKFLVISHDTDEQQFYHDFVMAANEEDAKATVLGIRDYCADADAISLRTVRTHYAALSKWTPKKVNQSWEKIVRAHKPNECDNCSKRWSNSEVILPIPNCEQRVDEDGPEPSGECPECHALCYERP